MRLTFAFLGLLFFSVSLPAAPNHAGGDGTLEHASAVQGVVSHDDNAGFPKLSQAKQTRHYFPAGQGEQIVTAVPAGKAALEKALTEYLDRKYSSPDCKVVPSTGLFGPAPFHIAYYTLACGDRGVPNQEQAPIIVGVNAQTGRLTDITVRGIPKTLDASSPTVEPAEALRVGREAFETKLNQTVKSVKGPVLKVLVDPQGDGQLAWVVTFSNGERRASKMLAGEFWIRATGEPVILALKQIRPFR